MPPARMALQALKDILAWGGGPRRGASSTSREPQVGAEGDPWHRYQTCLLPVLEAVASRHGRGFGPADAAFALQHCRKGPGETSAGIGVCAAGVVPVRIQYGERKGGLFRDKGRRGHELAALLDDEDFSLVKEAVAQGIVRESTSGRYAWQKDVEEPVSGGGDEVDEEGDKWRRPVIFL